MECLLLSDMQTGTIYGVALNYREELDQLGPSMYSEPYRQPPQAPVLYIKPVNTRSGHLSPIPLPKEEPKLKMGPALAIVIGKTASRIAEEDAYEYIAGYTVANDVSIPRDSYYRPAIRENARDGFCPIGHVAVRKEHIRPDHLPIRVYLNGELLLDYSSEGLVRSIPRLLADITEFMTLQEGDIILTGVPPGAPFAEAGDTVMVEIPGVGILENTIVKETPAGEAESG